MSKLNNDVRKDLRAGRFEKSSQHDDLGGDYHEKMSKHTSQEIRREVIKSSSIIQSRGGIDDVKRSFLEKSQDSAHAKRPTQSPISSKTGGSTSADGVGGGGNSYNSRLSSDTTRGSSPKFEESSTTRRLVREEKSSSSTAAGLRGGTPVELSPAFKSLQDRIDAFKREFENIENKVSHKSDSSKITKKTTNLEKSSNVEYVTRPNNGSTYGSSSSALGRPSYYRESSTSLPRRPETTSPSNARRDVPKASIKSLSEKFETLGRDDGEDFRRQTEAKRREFFNQIKSQVRETRKELDNFDPIDDDGDEVADRIERKLREKLGRASYQSFGAGYPSGTKPASETAPAATTTTSTTTTTTSASRSSQSPSSRPLSRSSGDGANPYQISKPKMFTKRETTQEKVISRVVRENDRIVKDETKRNVERSSSFHGSSDEDTREDAAVKNVFGEPNIIRYIDHELRSSPQSVLRTESPVDRLRREIPVVEPIVRGSGLMARTLYDYEAAERDELSFDADDLITNIEKIDKGWYKGAVTYKDGSKRVGLFPANYVRLLNDSSEY